MPSATECREVAENHYKAGRLDQAIVVACAGLEHFPDDGSLWETRALALHACKRFAEATDAFERAALLKPLSCFAQVGLASCYLVAGQAELAGVMYRHLVSQPSVPTTLLPAVAGGLTHVGEAHLAMEMHRERVRRDPDDAQALFALAHYMNHLGGPPEKVLPLLHRAIALAPDHPVYRAGLALMLARHGEIGSAYRVAAEIPVMEMVLACCPCRLRNLAILFHQAGDSERAKACESRVLEIAASKISPNDHTDGQT